MYETKIKENLVGKKVLKVFGNEEYLRFETDGGIFTYAVGGDCCSHSVFYDFIGVEKLLGSTRVISIKEVDLEGSDIEKLAPGSWLDSKDKNGEHECVSIYGYQIVSEHPEFGEVTSVFSFRNYSNGYYGGWMFDSDYKGDLPELKRSTSWLGESKK